MSKAREIEFGRVSQTAELYEGKVPVPFIGKGIGFNGQNRQQEIRAQGHRPVTHQRLGLLTRLKQFWQRLTGTNMAQTTGELFVVSAPSGAGKTSLVHAALARNDKLHMSVSYTTRPQRENEVHGVDYFFVSKAQFDEILARGELLEHAQVFDNYYGTGAKHIQAQLENGASVILEIDWQGAEQVRKSMPSSHSIFILPPSREELKRRLRGRRTDSDEVIARRLSDSVADMSHWNEFDYIVVNDSFDKAVNDLSEIFSGRADPYVSTRAELAPLVKELLG